MSWDKIENHLFSKYDVEGEDKELSNLMEEHDKEIRAKAIDEFLERIKAESYNGYVTLEDYSEDTIKSVALEDIEHIAEQMKGGAV